MLAVASMACEVRLYLLVVEIILRMFPAQTALQRELTSSDLLMV